MREKLTEKEKQMIEYIIRNINWDKISNVMKFLNWEWWIKTEKLETLSPDKLIEMGRNLLKDVCEKKLKGTGTGGLLVEREEDEKGNTVWLSLKFILEEWEVSLEDGEYL